MATIDTENAKQIRQPMDVIIKVTIEESANLTYTHSNTVKIADDVLDEPDWAMRKLADLQGDGFELDSSAHVYDSDVPPSLSNGKIGVRTVVADPVIITVTSDTALNYITVKATGASYVTYDNVDYSLTSGYAIIPVGGQTNFSMEFVGESIYKRVEVSDILPGIWLEITNENLISAVVSLRSDLSIIDPTLPESEINVEVYYDEDISEILAAIPDETPLTYQAGYPGDMSPVRKFYISEQVTWADNVISIHAVDAVHKLDEELPSAIRIAGTQVSSAGVTELVLFAQCLLLMSGIEANGGKVYTLMDNYTLIGDASDDVPVIVIPKQSKRETMAWLMNLVRQDFPAGYMRNGVEHVYITYVDAGIPTFSFDKPVSSWDIYETDCGEVARHIDRKITKLTVDHNYVSRGKSSGSFSNQEEIGSGTWFYQSGIALDFSSDYIEYFRVINTGIALQSVYDGRQTGIGQSGPITEVRQIGNRTTACAVYLVGPDIPKGLIKDGWTSNELYTQFMPWTTQQSDQWTAEGLDTSETYNPNIRGQAYTERLNQFSAGSDGSNEVRIKNDAFMGFLTSYGSSANQTRDPINVLPATGFANLLSRSNVTGSFRWKGDPRMQPRDVVTFHRLDGSTEEITLENITLTHEGGGTVAEITYRKGVV